MQIEITKLKIGVICDYPGRVRANPKIDSKRTHFYFEGAHVGTFCGRLRVVSWCFGADSRRFGGACADGRAWANYFAGGQFYPFVPRTENAQLLILASDEHLINSGHGVPSLLKQNSPIISRVS